MKKILLALCATIMSAWVILADYSQKVTSNVALYHGVRGPMDFSQLFLSQADLDYYLSNGTGSTDGVSDMWKAIRPLPYDGQVVALSVAGSSPKTFLLRANDDGTFSAVEIIKDNVVHKSVHTDAYAYTPVGTNVVKISGVAKMMKIRVDGLTSTISDIRTLKSNPSNFKLYVDGYSTPFNPTSFYTANETDSKILPTFSVGGTSFYVQVSKTDAGWWWTQKSSYTSESWTFVEAADHDWYEHEYSVRIGGGAYNPNALENVTINGCERYPSYTYGFSNINIGLDNIAGFGDDGHGGVKQTDGTYKTNAYYDVVIGTSSSAKYMHSYVFGSQAHALAPNSFIFGYGASTIHSGSTVIGFGSRPAADKKFSTRAEMLTWANSFANYTAATNAVFADYMISITNDSSTVSGEYYVKSVRTTKDATYGWIELYQDAPHDEMDEYIRGRHNWKYGITHGVGTVNLVAPGNTTTDYGPANVYINDRRMTEWFGMHVGEPVYKEQYVKGVFSDPVLCAADYTVAIGENAKATETASSCQSIAIGRDALSSGSATVAVGPNSYAEGAQAVAVGWRANAIGAHSVAIGSAKKSGNNYWVNGIVNPDSDLCQAVGDYSIAVGYNSKAQNIRSMAFGHDAKVVADNAVQIGLGTNDVANSLKFGNVWIVKNGEIVGATPEPTIEDVPEDAYEDGEYDLYLKSGSNVTLLPTKELNQDVEQINIHPTTTGKRNYTITIPNEPEVLSGMPIQIKFAFDDEAKCVYKNSEDGILTKLPAQVVITQPYSKLVIMDIQELDDGTDWTPHITRNNIGFSDGAFKSLGTTALRGWNLHAATEFKIAYPTASGVVTNDVLNLRSDYRCSVSHLYRVASMTDFTATGITADGDGNTWFEAIYATVNGKTNLVRKTFNATTGITLASEGLTRIGELTWTTEGGDTMTNGYFTVTTNSTSSIIVDPNEVFVKYVLQNNTTNTVKMSSMTGVSGGYRTTDIIGLKMDTTNSVEYITIFDDRTNYLHRVVSEL